MLAVILNGCSEAPTSETSSIKNRLTKIASAGVGDSEVQTPAISIAVVEEGHPIFVESFGMADLLRSEPASIHTQFNAASVSKAVTTIGVLKLVESGDLDLDSPLSTYISDFDIPSSVTENTTVRKILGHRAGLNMASVPWVFDPKEPVSVVTLLRDGYEDTEPLQIKSQVDDKWNYSGGGFALLQLVIESVSGLDFSEHMASRLFTPLRMTRTSFKPEEISGSGVATGYGDDRSKIAPYRIIGSAAGGLFSTAEDMTKFLSCYYVKSDCSHLSEKMMALISQDTMQVGLDGIDPAFFGGARYGLGHGVHLSDNATLLYHSGGNPGFLAYMIVDPTAGNGLALLTNGENARPLMEELRAAWAETYGYTLPKYY